MRRVSLLMIPLLFLPLSAEAFLGFGGGEEEETLVVRRSCVGSDFEAMTGPVEKLRAAVKETSPYQVAIEVMPVQDKYDRKDVINADVRFQRTVRGNPHIKLTRDFARKGFQPYVYAMVDEQGMDILLKNMAVCGLREVPE